jgi:eukaryotic-like serine/threonine-protein kinase
MSRMSTGYKLGSFEILDHLGTGLSGEVYKARYRGKTSVALKVFNKDREQDRTVLGYFLNEQMLIREVTEHRHHPNIIEYVTSREAQAPLYLATSYLEGARVLETMVNRPLPAGFVIYVIEKLANALDYLHYGNPKYSPIIHRDVKPHNVLIGAANEVILIDLSIARFPAYMLEDERGLGTVQYMPPEQYEGQEAPATDQFALAVMALQMLVGRGLLPSDKNQAREKLDDLHEDDFAPVRELLGERKHTIEVLSTALEYAPADRYSSCEEFAYQLRQALAADGEAVDDLRSPRQLPRAWLEIGVLTGVAIIAIVLLVVYVLL